MMVEKWLTSATEITVGAAAARTILRRAEQFDIVEGGRFQVREGSKVLLWSARRFSDGGRRAPIASFSIEWDSSAPGGALVHDLTWDSRECDILEIHRALELLVGVPALNY